MADLTITVANVKPLTGSTVKQGTAGATITQGMAVAIRDADKKIMPADNNAGVGSEDLRRPAGIAVNSALLDQPVSYVSSGPMVLGATLTANKAYYVGEAGVIQDEAGFASGEYAALLGMSTSAANFNVDIQFPGGVQVP